MNKPASLRKHLLSNIPSLAQNPESLIIYVEKGNLSTSLASGLNFNYHYQLNVIVTDFGQHSNEIIVPLLAWLKRHQIDLAQDAVNFDIDHIDHEKIDLEISFPLNECVIVKQNDEGQFSVKHLEEPRPDYNRSAPAPFDELFPITTNKNEQD